MGEMFWLCYRRDHSARALCESAIYQLISSVVSYGPYSQRHTTAELFVFLLAYKVERYLHQVLLLKLTHYERNSRTCFTK